MEVTLSFSPPYGTSFYFGGGKHYSKGDIPGPSWLMEEDKTR